MRELTYDIIRERALVDEAYRQGLLDAAEVCEAQGTNQYAPCPSHMAAQYLKSLANGELP